MNVSVYFIFCSPLTNLLTNFIISYLSVFYCTVYTHYIHSSLFFISQHSRCYLCHVTLWSWISLKNPTFRLSTKHVFLVYESRISILVERTLNWNRAPCVRAPFLNSVVLYWSFLPDSIVRLSLPSGSSAAVWSKPVCPPAAPFPCPRPCQVYRKQSNAPGIILTHLI